MNEELPGGGGSGERALGLVEGGLLVRLVLGPECGP